MANNTQMAEGFAILAKYDPTGNVSAEHDVVYAGPDPDRVSDEDKEALDGLGWFVSDEYDCFARFT